MRGSSATRGGGTCGWTHGAEQRQGVGKVVVAAVARHYVATSRGCCQYEARGRARVLARSWAQCASCPFVGQCRFLAYCVVGPPYPPRKRARPGGSTPGRPAGAYPQGMVTGDGRARTDTPRRAQLSCQERATGRAGPCATRNAPCARATSIDDDCCCTRVGLVIQHCHGERAQRGQIHDDDAI